MILANACAAYARRFSDLVSAERKGAVGGHRQPARMLAAVIILLCAARSHAADTVSYKVDFISVRNGQIDNVLKASSDLQSLRAAGPVSPFALIARARGDIDRLKTVLESFGYYAGKISILINGAALNEPTLADTLNALPRSATVRVVVSADLGILYRLRHIELQGNVPAPIDGMKTLGLASGEPAVAAVVLAAGSRLLNALEEQGFAFAKVPEPVAYEAADSPVLDLTFNVEAGPRVHVSDIRFEGLKRVHESLLRKRVLLRIGEQYSPSAVDQARRDLLALNVFSQVTVQVGRQADASGGVPIIFNMTERARHAVTLNAAYSTDLGSSAGASWTDRNVFGNAEQLTFAASIIDVGGSDSTGAGYDASVKYQIPEFLHRDQALQLGFQALKQSLQAYNQTSRAVSAALVRKVSSVWSVSAGLTATDEQISQNIVYNTPSVNAQGMSEPTTTVPLHSSYALLAFPVSVNYDSTHLASPLEDPLHGYRGSVSLTPTFSFGHPNAIFLITQVRASAYFDLSELLPLSPARTILALRAIAGDAAGAGEFGLPPDQRFYAGGSGTIRGYRYQSVGPVFDPTVNPPVPIGGTALSAGSVELRQRLPGNFGMAAFVDAGQVNAKFNFVPSGLRFGTGVGVRYYTPIGPIRLDLAVPLARRPTDDAFEVYIGLGQAF